MPFTNCTKLIPKSKLFVSTSRLHQAGHVELGFPTMFVFNKQYELTGKLSGAKMKLIDGMRPPREGEPNILGMQDLLEIDLNAYYEFFDSLRVKSVGK